MKLKPILIPTDRSYLYLHSGILYNNKTTQHIPDGNQQPVELILIDIEADIVEGDLVLYEECKVELANKEYIDFGAYGGKVMATTDRDSVAPFGGQYILDEPVILSPQSVQQLITYYNKWGKMPESVEVIIYKDTSVCNCGLRFNEHNVRHPFIARKIITNKQGEVDIITPKVEENLYTGEDVLELLDCAINNCYTDNNETGALFINCQLYDNAEALLKELKDRIK